MNKMNETFTKKQKPFLQTPGTKRMRKTGLKWLYDWP